MTYDPWHVMRAACGMAHAMRVARAAARAAAGAIRPAQNRTRVL